MKRLRQILFEVKKKMSNFVSTLSVYESDTRRLTNLSQLPETLFDLRRNQVPPT